MHFLLLGIDWGGGWVLIHVFVYGAMVLLSLRPPPLLVIEFVVFVMRTKCKHIH
jgi:hypothetical protein